MTLLPTEGLPPLDDAAFEAQVARVAASADDRAGLYGPGSAVWQVARESAVFLGAGCAALLQLAHPFVAQAIADHSTTRENPRARFQRTFTAVFAVTFGDLDDALACARQVHRIHRRITGHLPAPAGPFPAGTPYRALDPAALLWVHATLIHTSVRVYELAVAPLPPAERDRYVREARRTAALFGVPDDIGPSTWSEMDAYVAAMAASGRLAPTRDAVDTARFLLAPARPGLARLARWYRGVTGALLPERVATAFDLPAGPRARRTLARSLAAIRPAYRRLPPELRHLPAHLDALERLHGRPTGRRHRASRAIQGAALRLGERLLDGLAAR